MKLWRKITGKQNHGINLSSCAETGKLLTLPPSVILKKAAQVCGPQLTGKIAFSICGIQKTQAYNNRHQQELRDPQNPEDGFGNGFIPQILSHPWFFGTFFFLTLFPSFIPASCIFLFQFWWGLSQRREGAGAGGALEVNFLMDLDDGKDTLEDPSTTI